MIVEVPWMVPQSKPGVACDMLMRKVYSHAKLRMEIVIYRGQ